LPSWFFIIFFFIIISFIIILFIIFLYFHRHRWQRREHQFLKNMQTINVKMLDENSVTLNTTTSLTSQIRVRTHPGFWCNGIDERGGGARNFFLLFRFPLTYPLMYIWAIWLIILYNKDKNHKESFDYLDL
jgi:hypothetical protein